MNLHVVEHDKGTAPGTDRADVETLLAEATALADLIACASVSPAQPAAGSTAIAAQSIKGMLEQANRGLFGDPSA